MAIERWAPRREVTRQEQFLLKRLGRVKKLFGFLRRVRHELFNEEFQAELAGMYRDTGAGKQAVQDAHGIGSAVDEVAEIDEPFFARDIGRVFGNALFQPAQFDETTMHVANRIDYGGPFGRREMFAL